MRFSRGSSDLIVTAKEAHLEGPNLSQMTDREKVTRLGRLLADVAREHHEATGGENSEWARWYAARLVGQIDSLVGFSPEMQQIREWLEEADERHRAEAPEARWPFYYAELILDSAGDQSQTRTPEV